MCDFWNARFGDDGKLWHLGATLLVSVALWLIIIDVTSRILNL